MERQSEDLTPAQLKQSYKPDRQYLKELGENYRGVLQRTHPNVFASPVFKEVSGPGEVVRKRDEFLIEQGVKQRHARRHSNPDKAKE
jgi:hypothetical protein